MAVSLLATGSERERHRRHSYIRRLEHQHFVLFVLVVFGLCTIVGRELHQALHSLSQLR